MQEEEFNRLLVRDYFKYGSVEGALRAHRYNLPVSYATYQRVLDSFGVVKTAGPNNKLTEAIDFLSSLATDNLSIESLYKKIPLRFQTSAATLYRILSYVKEGLTRRVGVGLILTPYNSKERVLVAKDVSTPRIELGKIYASLSLPMGYARKRDSRQTNILRILQQEVFTQLVIKQKFSESIIPVSPEPLMYLDIADVRVAIYHLQLSKELSGLTTFSSFKLTDYVFKPVREILSEKELYRVGVKEAVLGYTKYLNLLSRNLVANPIQAQSLLNRELATVEIEVCS